MKNQYINKSELKSDAHLSTIGSCCVMKQTVIMLYLHPLPPLLPLHRVSLRPASESPPASAALAVYSHRPLRRCDEERAQPTSANQKPVPENHMSHARPYYQQTNP